MWNIATDAVINANLKKDGLKMPEDGGVDIPGAENCDAETMYQKLLKEKQKRKQNEKQGKLQSIQGDQGNETKNNNSQSQSGPGSHGLWNKAIEDRKKEQQKSEKTKKREENNSSKNENDKKDINDQEQNEERKKKNTNADNESQKSSINDSQKKNEEDENVEEIRERNVFEQNRIERKKRLKDLNKELAKKSSKNPGKQFSTRTRSLSDIGIAIPLIDWRRLLRQAIKYNEEYTRKNARMRNGFFRYRIEQIPMSETEIVLDVSGSVSDVLLKNFLRECKNILENSKVKVGCFDTEFHGFTEIRRLEDIDKLNFPTGGGTDFNVAVRAFSRRTPNRIIFTDGEAPMPSENVRDVIWVVFGDKKIDSKGGKVINITGEQLERLYQRYNRFMASEK